MPPDAHLGFVEGRGPNFEIGQVYKYCTHLKKNLEHNPMYFLILSLPQKLNTPDYKPMHPFSESSLFIG